MTEQRPEVITESFWYVSVAASKFERVTCEQRSDAPSTDSWYIVGEGQTGRVGISLFKDVEEAWNTLARDVVRRKEQLISFQAHARQTMLKNIHPEERWRYRVI